MKYVQRIVLMLGLVGLVGLGGVGPARGDSILITFDTDANGNPIVAPSVFSQTTALTTLYAPLGVIFSGPGGNNGGAIVNAGEAPPPSEDGPPGGGGPVADFGVFAYSGSNVLAFNRNATLAGETESNGGIPNDPETITFAKPWVRVSIFAAGGFASSMFTMDGYDVNGNLVGSTTITTENWAQLQLISAADPIASVVLTETSLSGALGDGFLYDNLFAASTVPEPSTLVLLGIGSIGFIGYAWLRRGRTTRPASIEPGRGSTSRI